MKRKAPNGVTLEGHKMQGPPVKIEYYDSRTKQNHFYLCEPLWSFRLTAAKHSDQTLTEALATLPDQQSRELFRRVFRDAGRELAADDVSEAACPAHLLVERLNIILPLIAASSHFGPETE